MTAQEAERLAVVENDIKWLVQWAEGVDKRFDEAIACKADKTDVDSLRKKVWAIVIGVAAFALTTLVGLFIFVVQGHIRF